MTKDYLPDDCRFRSSCNECFKFRKPKSCPLVCSPGNGYFNTCPDYESKDDHPERTGTSPGGQWRTPWS